MEKIRVQLGERSYDIVLGNAILDGIGEELKAFHLSPKIAIVSNPTVFSLYGERVSDSIRNAGFDLLTVTIPDGEEHKNLVTLQQIYNELLRYRLDRKSAVVALGGGVVGDITGFAASTYMRGIPYVQIPTTLLAQVDSSVGGKTGVDHALGKNMIGAFWQPKLVWIDGDTLKTLPERQLRAGLAEVIKYGVIYDSELFTFIERNKDRIMNLDEEALIHIIKRSCEIKAGVVAQDEREAGLRAILNYGHTIGHAIETITGYTRFLHGEAVAIGMHLEARLAEKLGLIPEDQAVRIKNLIESYGLPVEKPNDIKEQSLFLSMQLDKKAVAGELKFILPEKIGQVRIQEGISDKTLRELFVS
ncbi:MAG: 3-dehydroquinate synthase [Thermodesulfovibrionales bacterium]|nr:3-dehydroquinate synthase [Thermodesulfovibrionales bacterium]